MDDAQGEILVPRAVDDLQQTTRVASGNDARLGAADVLELALEQGGGHLRLNQVVDARAPAAPGAFGQFSQREMGNGAEHLSRLGRDFLAVAKVAGLVISHGLRRNVRAGRRLNSDLHEPLVDVLDLVVPLAGEWLVARVAGEQLRVVLQMRAATRRVADDGVELHRRELVDLPARELLRQLPFPVVRMERAATKLC